MAKAMNKKTLRKKENRQGGEKWATILKKETDKNVKWLMKISDKQREILKNYLLNIDKTYRVDPDSGRSRIVRQGIRDIVEKIAVMIAERKPELKGHIIPRGSAHNGTKIGQSDEFDFVYQMEMDNFLNGLGTVKCVHNNTVHINPIPDADVDKLDPQPSQYVLQKALRDDQDDGEDLELETSKIQKMFRKVLCEVLSELELPPGWFHGGFNRPNFSGLRIMGPSHVLQFDYLAVGDKTPLRISLDFVPMLKCQPISNLPKPRPLEACLIDETSLPYGWCSLHRKPNYYGLAEDLWLSNFSTQSTSKTAMRISKVLHRLVKAAAAKYPSQLDVSKIDRYMKDTTPIGRQKGCNLKLTVLKRDGFLYAQDHFLSYSDLNETTGEDSILKSYYIKRLVMSMMFADKESQGREWTDDDLPDLVISIYMILHEALVRQGYPKQVTKNKDEFFEKTISVPLKEIHAQMEDTRRLPDQVGDSCHNCEEELSELLEDMEKSEDLPDSRQLKKGRLVVKPGTPKFYRLLNESTLIPHEIGHFQPCLIADSKISAIFKLLKAVCEGRSSVDIVLLGLNTKRNNSDIVQKTDVKELLHALKLSELGISEESMLPADDYGLLDRVVFERDRWTWTSEFQNLKSVQESFEVV